MTEVLDSLVDKTVSIGDWEVKNHGRPFIIAEAGLNHNGDIDVAKEMIKEAKNNGANAIKFQTFIPEKLVSPSQRDALEFFQKVKFSYEEFEELFNKAKAMKITMISTPFDPESAEFLLNCGVPAMKIASGDLTYKQLIERCAKMQIPLIVSTGMSYLNDILQTIEWIIQNGGRKIILLHCVSNYPTTLYEANLNSIRVMQEYFNIPVGYSDHTIGIKAALIAVAMGAAVIEKHFTLDKSLEGPDHEISMLPEELKELREEADEIIKIKGMPAKKPTERELSEMKLARRSLIALRDIERGEVFTSENIGILRPAQGLEPKYFEKILGRTSKNKKKKGEPILWGDIN